MAFEGQVAEASMTWMDGLWDDDTALLWGVRRGRHLVRETAWYAMGLLQRGDAARAERALRAVLANQFPMNGTAFAGTFRRAPEEPDPPDEPVMWRDYDPNWRQFIGTTFAVIVDDHGDALADTIVDDLRASIAGCVAGEPDDRVEATYANIALMKAWLDTWAGRVDSGEPFARVIYAEFDAHGAFLEYNSPTYYGVDIWALALWRRSTSELQRLGADMERRLWDDVARFYHAGLRNLCGPFDRHYGMDMTRYATPLGLYIWSAVGRDLAPFPDTSARFSHPHDCCFGPLVAAAPTVVPDDVLNDLVAFRGERVIERTISDDPLRVATAWLGPHAMVGAQTGPAGLIGRTQHTHGTIHTPSGWLRLLPQAQADAIATPHTLEITSDGAITLDTSGALRVELDASVDPVSEEHDGRSMLTFDGSGTTRVSVRCLD